MTYTCPLCQLLPSSHSLRKVLEKKAILYYDTIGIVNHYDGVLSDVEDKDKEWVWIFDRLYCSRKGDKCCY